MAAEVVARSGVDLVVFDLQHGNVEEPDLIGLLQASQPFVPALVRLRAVDPAQVTRVLDLGAGNGYSTLYLADGMAGEGEIVALECDPRRAVAARQNLADCGVRTSVLIGAAQEVLPGLRAPFDLILLDIDKTEYLYALDHCARLLRPGGLLVADNTGFADAEPFNAALAADQRFRSVNLLCLLPGHNPEQDGVAFAARL